MNFACFGMHLRITWCGDVYHDTNNDVLGAIAATGLTSVVHETTLLLNFEHAPWRSCAFYQSISEGWSEFLVGATPEDDLYADLYERIAFDLGEQALVNTLDNFERLFEAMKCGETAAALDERVCLSRRFSVNALAVQGKASPLGAAPISF